MGEWDAITLIADAIESVRQYSGKLHKGSDLGKVNRPTRLDRIAGLMIFSGMVVFGLGLPFGLFFGAIQFYELDWSLTWALIYGGCLVTAMSLAGGGLFTLGYWLSRK